MAITDTNGGGAGTGVLTGIEAGDNWDDAVERLALESLAKRVDQVVADTQSEIDRAQETLDVGRTATRVFDRFVENEAPLPAGNRMRRPGYPYLVDRAPFVLPSRALPDFNLN